MAQSQVSESGDSHRIWQIIFELCLHIVCDPFFNTLTENVQKHATVQKNRDTLWTNMGESYPKNINLS